MTLKIRKSTFETNSSSAHSLTLRYNYPSYYNLNVKSLKKLNIKIMDYDTETKVSDFKDKLNYLTTYIAEKVHNDIMTREQYSKESYDMLNFKEEIIDKIQQHPLFLNLKKVILKEFQKPEDFIFEIDFYIPEDYEKRQDTEFSSINYGFNDDERDGGLIYSLLNNENMLSILLFNDSNSIYYGDS